MFLYPSASSNALRMQYCLLYANMGKRINAVQSLYNTTNMPSHGLNIRGDMLKINKSHFFLEAL